MRYTVTLCTIEVVGRLWMPGVVAATSIPVDAHDLENIGEWTRENVERWLATHSGDFSEIIDFRADFSEGERDWVSDWAEEENEWVYADCMFPSEE